MDVSKSVKSLGNQFSAETTRPPLVSADNKNGSTQWSQTREVSSRYRSPTPSGAAGPKRYPSPSAQKTSSTSTVSVSKRAISAERKRPTTPSSPSSHSPSTPIKDTTTEMLLTPRKSWSNKLQESLWPTTMRSLSVSFKSDVYAIPTGKREKVVSHTPSDRTLRPSSNLARKGETPLLGKPTPERNRSPLKGKNSAAQVKNSKPVDGLQARLVDQHKWPSRTSGKTTSPLNRSYNIDKVDKSSSSSHSRTVSPSTRRLSLNGTTKRLQKSSSDSLMLISHLESGKEMTNGSSVDDGLRRIQRPCSSSSSDRTSLVNGSARAQLRAPSPSASRGKEMTNGSSVDDGLLRIQRPRSSSSSDRTSLVNGSARAELRAPSPSASRGISPSRAKVVTPSRGTSPARIKPLSPSRQPQNSTSVLSFIADIKKGNKTANNIEDVHKLRLLYNRHLQWQYANARTVAALHFQKAKAETMLYKTWRIIKDLSDSVREKRSNLQQLRLKLKLYTVLLNQVTCLDELASIESDHINSLTQAIQDLQASTLRLPLTEGARGDIKSIKAAICSAVDLMKTMGSSLYSILSKMEGMNCLVLELADVAARERAMLNECESLFGSAAAMQVEEYSLRIHLLQMKHAWSAHDFPT